MAINKQNKKVPRMPNDLVAESAVLGCMLINNNSVSKAIQILEPDSFYNFKNKVIFENMTDLFEKNKAIDYVSLIDQLKKNKKLDEIGKSTYITGLSEKAPSAENVEYYAQIVKEKFVLRQIIDVSINISEQAYDGK